MPERTCVVCRKKAHPNDLLRVRRDVDWVVDGPCGGRSLYLCRGSDCATRLPGPDRLGKLLRQKVGPLERESLVLALQRYCQT